MKVIAGIDPGCKGGIVLFQNEKPSWLHELSKFDFRQLRACTHVFVEKAMPINYGKHVSIKSTFSTALNFGRLIGFLEAFEVPHSLVPPQTWQKIMWLGTDSKLDAKPRSLQAAKRLFPSTELRASERCRIAHDGIVDALLIAEYGRRVLIGGLKAEPLASE